MPNTLIIGAGGVGSALAHKCAQYNDELGDLCIASRTLAKCERIIEKIRERGSMADRDRRLTSAHIDARDADAVTALIRSTGSRIVLNVAAPFCNLAVMEACLRTGARYVDTAVYEQEDLRPEPPPWYANYEWKLRDRFARRGVTAVLGAGFDPGAVNAFCAYVQKHHIDAIETIDIMDVNAGDHGQYFATNFDPEINLNEIREDVIYWRDGDWVTAPHHSQSRVYDFPEVGEHRVYAVGHDEVHSLAVNIPARRIQFWMGFGDHYLKCFEVLERIGMLSSKPVEVGGVAVAPLKVLKAVLPEPASLAPGYTGKTCIGCLIRGTRRGEPRELFIYNVCEHEACYREVGAQAISYTTAVPVATTALLIARGDWDVGELVNVEQLDPDPFMELMPKLGLAWHIRDSDIG